MKPAGVPLTALALGLTVFGATSAPFGSLAAAGISEAASAPAGVTATQLPADKPPFTRPGTIVSSSRLSVREFVNDKDGFSLAFISAGGGATYPAATTNGGKTWRIDGPHFHVNGANAPNVVTQLGAASPATFFAYGGPGGGNSVNVTTDGGKHWWRVYLPGTPLAIVDGHVSNSGALIAFVQPGPAQLWTYVSTDGGRHWHHSKAAFG
jgi:hypothetical protein